MDIAQQLSQKHPKLFDPLIAAYKESRPAGVVHGKLKYMIESLLSSDGDIVQMYVNGHDHQAIANQIGLDERTVRTIITKYNQRNVINFDLIAESTKQRKRENLKQQNENVISKLKVKYDYLFDPLIESYLNIPKDDDEQHKKISKLIKNLLDDSSNHGKIVELYNEGFTLQDIGDQYGVTRERIRQIIKKYEGYYIVVGSKEWCLKELEKLTKDKVKRLPSNRELNIHHSKLIESLRGNFSGSKRNGNLSIEERLEVGTNTGYDTFVGTKEWCLQELNKLISSHGKNNILPSNEELDNYHLDLAGHLKEHFTQSKTYGKLKDKDRLEIVKFLGYDIVEEVKNHTSWSEERLIYEVRDVAKQLGKPDLMPMQTELVEIGRQDLRGTIGRFGGQSKVAKLAGLTYQGQTVGEDGRTYWTDERIQNFLYDVAEKEGHPEYMPTQQECAKYYEKGNVIVAIFTDASNPKKPTLTWFEVSQKYGLKFDTDFHRITINYIKAFVKGLGDSLFNLTPSEIYVLFEQQGINKTGINTFRDRTFDTLIEAIQSGNLPHEEIDKWVNDQPAQIVDALLDPENKTVEEAFRKVDKRLNKTDHKTKTENPSDENYQEDIEQDLPAPNAGDTLKSLSVTT
ncbi:MAG: sigma factor-like helix-turn-helix DNA-binding protein, partial [Pseudanabaena sp.]